MAWWFLPAVQGWTSCEPLEQIGLEPGGLGHRSGPQVELAPPEQPGERSEESTGQTRRPDLARVAAHRGQLAAERLLGQADPGVHREAHPGNAGQIHVAVAAGAARIPAESAEQP